MKKNYKIITIIVILLLSYISISSLYLYESEKTLKKQKYLEVAEGMKRQLKILIDEKREAILLVSLSLAQNRDVKNTLLGKEQGIYQLHFDEFSQRLHRDSTLKNVWFQLLDKKGKSLYRSWTKTRGDNLVNSRLDVAKMLKNPKIISSISTGKFDMTFKSMVPIYEKENFIGVIETIARFNSVAIKIRKEGYKILILVDKSYTDQLNKVKKDRFVNGYYIALNSVNEVLLRLFKKQGTELLKIHNYKIEEKEGLLLTTYHLKDINSKEMGYFIISKNLNNIDVSDINKTLQSIFITLFFIGFLIIGFSYYIYIIKYRRFIENQNEKLEKDVKSKTEELYHYAHHDALTNLPNRVLFSDKVNEALKFASRHNVNIFVLFLDLDRFKEVNDTYGHNVGDKLLYLVTQRLQSSMREIDVIARLGGDEFTILIQDVTYKDMILIVKKIIYIMQEAFFVDTIKIHSSFSIGVSNYPSDGSSVEELLKNADIAMYQAKADGKNSFKFYNQKMSDLAHERITLENDIKSALENREFEAYFQPKVNSRTQKIIGLEALIRWNHPKKGLVFPDKFINFAEEIGLIVAIDSFMRRETMLITKKWTEKGLDFGKVSFNVSTLEFKDKNFVRHIKELVQELEYDASKLELEILESQSIENPESMIGMLKEIRELGIIVSLDDFGTGYSSLSYLKKLPVDKLKIDRSFIIDTPQDSDSVALVRTIIALANNLGLEVIAEGVESKEQVDFLLEEGCENIQGYYYSKPVPAEEVEKLLVYGFKNLG